MSILKLIKRFISGRSDFYLEVKHRLDNGVFSFVTDTTFKVTGAKNVLLQIIDARYDSERRMECFELLNTKTHDIFRYEFELGELKDVSVDDILDAPDTIYTRNENYMLAKSYAVKSLELPQLVELIVGETEEGDLLTLFSGSRPSHDTNVVENPITNFHVLDAKTKKFKWVMHWRPNYGRPMGIKLRPINEAVTTLAHWVLEKDSRYDLRNWFVKTKQSILEDYPHVAKVWGDSIDEQFKIGSLVTRRTQTGPLFAIVVAKLEGGDLLIASHFDETHRYIVSGPKGLIDLSRHLN